MYNIVYLTTNLVNLKVYVGVHSTLDLNDKYLGSGVALNRAIKKYGRHNFTRQILHFAIDASHAHEIETSIVDLRFINSQDTYNMTLGGTGSWHHRRGIPLTDEHKAKLSKHNTGKLVSPETCKRISKALTGKPRPQYVKDKVSIGNTGKIRTESFKLNLSKKNNGSNNPFYGKNHSQETKQKIGNREYNNRIKIIVNDVLYDSLVDARIQLKFGVNYLTSILKELQTTNELTKYYKKHKKYYTFKLVVSDAIDVL